MNLIFSESLSIALNRVSNMTYFLVASTLLSRLLEAEEFHFWLSFAGALGVFSIFDFGLGNAHVNHATAIENDSSRDQELYLKSFQYFSYSILLLCILCNFSYSIAYIFIDQIMHPLSFFYYTIIILASVSNAFFAKYFLPMKKYSLYMVMISILNFLCIAMLPLLYFVVNSPLYILLAFVNIFCILAYNLYYSFNYFHVTFYPQVKIWRNIQHDEYLQHAFDFLQIQILAALSWGINIILISFLFSIESAAIFAIIMKIFQPIKQSATLMVNPLWKNLRQRIVAHKTILWTKMVFGSSIIIVIIFSTYLSAILWWKSYILSFFFNNLIQLENRLLAIAAVWFALEVMGHLSTSIFNSLGWLKFQRNSAFTLVMLSLPFKIWSLIYLDLFWFFIFMTVTYVLNSVYWLQKQLRNA